MTKTVKKDVSSKSDRTTVRARCQQRDNSSQAEVTKFVIGDTRQVKTTIKVKAGIRVVPKKRKDVNT
jgi:hypothetical protein